MKQVPFSGYLRLLLDTTPRQWLLFVRRKSGRDPSLPHFDESHPAIFTLSTGRVGTQTLAALLALSTNLLAFHEPAPKLYGLGQLAYLHGDEEIARQILLEAVHSAREEAWKYALEAGRGYAETSPQLTFLAPFLLELHPQARFILLTRHPYAVIRSGMRRGWYVNHPADRTRLHPRPEDALRAEWQHLPPLARIAWLWAETNRWLLAFGESLPSEQILFLRAEDLFTGEPGVLTRLYHFAGASLPPQRKIQRILGRKLNAQKTGDFPPPAAWDEAQRQEVWRRVGEIATRLGYSK